MYITSIGKVCKNCFNGAPSQRFFFFLLNRLLQTHFFLENTLKGTQFVKFKKVGKNMYHHVECPMHSQSTSSKLPSNQTTYLTVMSFAFGGKFTCSRIIQDLRKNHILYKVSAGMNINHCGPVTITLL